MKILSSFSTVIFLSASAQASDEPPLPLWEDKQRTELESGGWLPGAILLTGDPLPGEPERTAAEPLELESPTAEEIAGDGALLPELPEKFLADYFAERPKNFLVDPQGLLGPADYRDRLNFLNYHASDSSIDLFVYLLESNQEIPGEVRHEEMTERLFNEGRPAAIVFYYLGAPQRSMVYLSPSLTDSISTAEQHRALESSVMQALEKTNPSEQFEKFLVQMSIRIYWMERMLSATVDAHPNATPVVTRANRQGVKTPAQSGKFLWLRQIASNVGTPVVLTVALLLAAFGCSRWLRMRARYRFPDLDVEPRLGGGHAAGVGAVISFSSAAVPPASQRDQVPDYLRRM